MCSDVSANRETPASPYNLFFGPVSLYSIIIFIISVSPSRSHNNMFKQLLYTKYTSLFVTWFEKIKLIFFMFDLKDRLALETNQLGIFNNGKNNFSKTGKRQ